MHRVRQFFDGLVDRFGLDARSANWSGPASQEVRFAVLADHLDIAGRRLLDVGCGLLDFYGYLKRRGIQVASYHGWDLSPKMVALARQRFPEVAHQVQERDFLKAGSGEPELDWVVCSGSLNYGHEWHSFQKAVRRMYGLGRLGAAFNVLSTYADFQEEGYFYASPEDTFRWCRQLTPWATLIHSYLPHDFTMILRKERQRYDLV